MGAIDTVATWTAPRQQVIAAIATKLGWLVEKTHGGQRAIAFAGDGKYRILYTIHSDESLWMPDQNLTDAMEVFVGLWMHCGWLGWAGEWWASTHPDAFSGSPFGQSENLLTAIFIAAAQDAGFLNKDNL